MAFIQPSHQSQLSDSGEWLGRLDAIDWIVVAVIAVSWLLPMLRQFLTSGETEVPTESDEDEGVDDPRPIEPR